MAFYRWIQKEDGIIQACKVQVTWICAVFKELEQKCVQDSWRTGTRKTGIGGGKTNKVKKRSPIPTAQEQCLLTYYKMPTFPTQPRRVSAEEACLKAGGR